MSTARDLAKKITKLSREGKMDGDAGVKQLTIDGLKLNFDIDFNEKPYFRTALWEGTWKNHEHIVRFLAEKRANISFADYQGRTPLHEAAYYGHLNLVEFFLDNKAPLDVQDIFGQSPIYRATEAGRYDVVKLLVERKAQTNLIDTDDVNVHHMAAFHGMPAMADWLMYKGAWRNRYQLDEGNAARSKAEATAAAAEAAEKGEEEGAEPDSPGVSPKAP